MGVHGNRGGGGRDSPSNGSGENSSLLGLDLRLCQGGVDGGHLRLACVSVGGVWGGGLWNTARDVD